MAPKDFSSWDALEEVFLTEAAELSPRNAECTEVNVSHAELLHYPHHPVEYLVCRPLHWVWRGTKGKKKKDKPINHPITYCRVPSH